MSTLVEQLAAVAPDKTSASLTVTRREDLTPLAAHPQLTSLSLWGACPDLTPLAASPALAELRLYKVSGKSDLSPLAGLPALRELSVSCAISAAQGAALSGCSGLRSLSVEGGEAHLGGLSEGLEQLYVGGTKAADLAPIAHLSLKQLHVGGARCAVEDLRPIAGMRSLQRLTLVGAKVSDLRPLAALTGLEQLSLQSAKALSSLEGLEGLTLLEDLNLNLTAVEDLTPLSGLTRLRTLRLRRTRVTALDGLLGLSALEILHLEKSRLKSLEGVQALSSLKSFWFFDTKVRRLAPLSGHPTLARLNIAGLKKLEDPEVLSTLTQLQDLDAFQVGLDPAVLVPLAKLETVRGCDFPPPGWAGHAAARPVGAEELGPGSLLAGSAQLHQLPGEPQDIVVDAGVVYLALLGAPEASTLAMDPVTGERVGAWNPGRAGCGVAVAKGCLYVLDRDDLGRMQLWRRINGALERWKTPEGRGYGAQLVSSPDGRALAIAGEGVEVLDLNKGGKRALQRPRAASLYQACRACFSARGTLFVSGLEPGVVQELSVPRGEVLRRVPIAADELGCLHLGPAGRFLVAKGWVMGAVSLIDLETNQEALPEDRHFGPGSRGLSAGAVSADGSLLVVPRSQLRAWRLPPGAHAPGFVRGPKLPVRGRAEVVARLDDALLFGLVDQREGTKALLRVPLVSHTD